MAHANDGFVRTVRINSEERLNPTGTVSNNFTVSLGQSTQLADINRISIKSIGIPNTQYNIQSVGIHKNNVFSYTTAAGPRSVTITAGNYNMSQLISAIVSGAQPTADGLTIALGATSSKLTFTSTTPITYLNFAAGNIMAPTLGITASSAPLVNTFTAQGLPYLNVHPNIYVTSLALSDGSAMISPVIGSIPVCAVVPIDQPFGNIIQYVTRQEHLDDIHYISYANGKTLQSIDLQLYDGDAQLIDMQGLDWTIVFRVYQSPIN